MLKEILKNPWVINVVTGVAVGLILYFVFRIGKTKKESKKVDFSDWKIKDNIVSGQNASLVQINYPINNKEGKKNSDSNLEVQEKQKQKFEENRKNFLDPRNSNK